MHYSRRNLLLNAAIAGLDSVVGNMLGIVLIVLYSNIGPYGVLYDTTPVFPNKYTSKKVNVVQEMRWVARWEGIYLATSTEKKNTLCTPLCTETFKGQG